MRVILDGVERNESMIIFPEKYRRAYYEAVADPQVMESPDDGDGRRARAAYERGGNYY